MERYSPTEQKGINEIQGIVTEMGWIFREQLKDDMGIDGHIEIVVDGKPTGRLIAVQIKSGDSQFKDHEEHITYYGSLTHLNYWLQHSLPVIIAIYSLERKIIYWEVINPITIRYTEKAWAVDIPKENIFDHELSKLGLTKLANKSTHASKLDKLAIDWGLIKHINEGGKINIYTVEYFHKTLGRGPFKVILIDKDGNEIITKEWSQYYLSSLSRVLERHFPWASFSIDEYYYELNSDIDPDEFEYYPTDNPYNLYPYTTYSGEAGAYRIDVTLNDVGKAFVVLMEYLQNDI